MADCTFCGIYADKTRVVYENAHFFAQFDAFPVSPGHAEVIPKRHVVSLFDLTAEEWAGLKPAISDVVKLIEKTDFRELYEKFMKNPVNDTSLWYCSQMLRHAGLGRKPDGYNVGLNEGEAAGRTIHHLHLHIIPRYFGDVRDRIGGIRNVIPKMGDYSSGRQMHKVLSEQAKL